LVLFRLKGVAYLKLGNGVEALAALDKALSQDPEHHYAAIQRAAALEHLMRVRRLLNAITTIRLVK
jgi:Tfp pilus assembly protein PilF